MKCELCGKETSKTVDDLCPECWHVELDKYLNEIELSDEAIKVRELMADWAAGAS